MSTTPADGIFGRDDANRVAQGGFTSTGVGLTQEMSPGVGAGRGWSIVEVGAMPASAAPAFVPLSSPSVVVGIAPVQLSALSVLCKSLAFANDDGNSAANGNTNVIYIGDSNVAFGTNGFPLRPGGGYGADASDLSDWWAVSDAAGQVLSISLIG